MTEKRIIIVTSELVPFYYGGIGTQFRSLAALLKRHGHHVSLLVRRPENFDANIYRSHYGDTSLFLVDAPPVCAWPPEHFTYAAEVARRFAEIYSAVHPQLAIFADFNAEGLFLLLRSGAGAFADTEFLVTLNGMNHDIVSVHEGSQPVTSPSLTELSDVRLLLAMEDISVQLAPRIVSPTVRAWQEIRKRLGICRTARIIPNLVDLDLFNPGGEGTGKARHQEQLILFVGRLDRIKGADLLLKAYFEVADQMRPAIPRIIFIGRDCYWSEYGSTFLEYWRDRIPERYAAAITFLGQVGQDVIRDYLKKATVAIFPSRWEMFGIVCLEALSMGCPVVVSKGTGLEDVLGSELSEFAVPVTEDVQPLAQKILSLLLSENRGFLAGGSNCKYADLPEYLRTRAKELFCRAETGWLDLLGDLDRKEEAGGADLRPFCDPLQRLLSSIEDSSWRGAAHLQIYFRRQGDYTECDSLRISYLRLCWVTLKIPLPGGTGETPLRMDPADTPGVIRIKEIVLTDETEKEIWRTDGSNGFRGCGSGDEGKIIIENSCLVVHAATNDPQLLLDCPMTDQPVNMRVVIYASGE